MKKSEALHELDQLIRELKHKRTKSCLMSARILNFMVDELKMEPPRQSSYSDIATRNEWEDELCTSPQS